jgi:hypothetical protein
VKHKQGGLALLLALLLLLPILGAPLGMLPLVAAETPPPLAGEGEDEAYRVICEGLLLAADEIDLSQYRLTKDELHELYSRVYWCEAEIFYLDGYTSRVDSSGRVVKLRPIYSMSDSEIAAARAEFYEMTAEILAGAERLSSDLARIAYVHDYIALHFRYDEALGCYDAYSMLKSGGGVCQSYSLLARYLLRRLGIEAECVVSEEINHEWNAVKLGDFWYNMDITWDERDDRGLVGQVEHEYFLCSDADFMGLDNGHRASDWISPVACTDTGYDGVFADVTSAMIEFEGKLYAISGNNLSYYLENTRSFSELASLGYWKAGLGSVWRGTYAGLWRVGNQLIYNTESSIKAYDLRTGLTTTLSSPYGGASRHMYGMRLGADGVATVSMMETPNDTEYIAQEVALSRPVTWVILGQEYAEQYLIGRTPVCPIPTVQPTDDCLYTFLRWETVRGENDPGGLCYEAVYEVTRLYEESAVEFISLVEAGSDRLLPLSERYGALSRAASIVNLINPEYEGVADARTALASAVQDYRREVEDANIAFHSLLFAS